ncbi:hypothetical protein Sango_1901900 [Sesamum angolense]|uniref:Uncharacterized protein n=1 Tax=Sesamum angolense TaxID=2727404 RepID=A0AAE2BQQ7_9LAMI|nr:hypothetical protein Sango_1901900 [Sesamum angolense]
MFRALSTRRSRRGYEHLADDDGDDEETSTPAALLPAAKLSRAKSLPAKIFSCSSKNSRSAAAEQVVIKKASEVHPFFSLFETSRRKKKATAKPEFSRYLEYVREGGGVWDVKENMPVVYNK